MYSTSTATGGANSFGYNSTSPSFTSTSTGTGPPTAYGVKGRNNKQQKSDSRAEAAISVNKTDASNGSNNTPNNMGAANNRKQNTGVYTCQTCNALFTCLQYYQQHRKHHAECNGIKLLCCNHCHYSTDNQFHYNWHIMSHTGESPHSCSVCFKPDDTDSSNVVQNHIKLEAEEENPPSCSMIGKRSVATATTDDLLLIGSTNTSTTCRLPDAIEQAKEHNQNHFQQGSYSTPSQQNRSIKNQKLFNEGSDDEEEEEEDDEEEDEDQEEEEEEEGEETGNNVEASNGGEAIDQDDEISDEEDDEEEEVESEEDDGDEDYLAPGAEGRTSVGEQTPQYQLAVTPQGPPYTKSPNAVPGSAPLTTPGLPGTGRGRGKGNRKSRAISSSADGSDADGSGTGELRRKFHCSHCGKSFKTKSHLQRHILTHTGEKPYHCNRCGSKFNQSSSLRNHIIAIHTKEYPHYCPQCGKGFLMPALLHKHLATSHRNK